MQKFWIFNGIIALLGAFVLKVHSWKYMAASSNTSINHTSIILIPACFLNHEDAKTCIKVLDSLVIRHNIMFECQMEVKIYNNPGYSLYLHFHVMFSSTLTNLYIWYITNSIYHCLSDFRYDKINIALHTLYSQNYSPLEIIISQGRSPREIIIPLGE